MATQSSVHRQERSLVKREMARAGGSAARSGENVVPISPASCAQDMQGSQARDHQVTLARGDSKVAKSCVPLLPTSRAAYSPAEFATSCGRHPSWAYRLLYAGKVRALTDLGRILISASELERILATATPYNPKPRKHKTQLVRSGATARALKNMN
jgi:hypothetical protein